MVSIKMELKMNRIASIRHSSISRISKPFFGCLRALRSAVVVLQKTHCLKQLRPFAEVSDVLGYLDCKVAAGVPSAQALTVQP